MSPGNRGKDGHLGRFSKEKASVQGRYLYGSAPLHENGGGEEHNKHNTERTHHDGIASNKLSRHYALYALPKGSGAQKMDSNPPLNEIIIIIILFIILLLLIL